MVTCLAVGVGLDGGGVGLEVLAGVGFVVVLVDDVVGVGMQNLGFGTNGVVGAEPAAAHSLAR